MPFPSSFKDITEQKIDVWIDLLDHTGRVVLWSMQNERGIHTADQTLSVREAT